MAMNDFADLAEFLPPEQRAVDPLEQYVPLASMGQMPTLGAAMSNSRKGWFMPGVKAGVQDIGGMLAAGVGAVGGAVGSDAVRDWGIAQSDAFQRQARRVGRPDLDYTPWSPEWAQARKGVTDIPEWLGYQVAKQLPQVGLAMAGGGAVGAGLKAAGYVAPGAEFAAALPRALGGGGLSAGMTAEEAAAARAAGQSLTQQFAGTTLAGMPQATGSMYQSEVDRARATGEQPRQGAAIGSLLASPVYSALDAAGPSTEVGMLRRGLEGGLAKRVGTAALSEGVQEFVQEGAQTGMEMALRPDLSPVEKAQNVLDAALTGSLVGGVMGAPGGIRRLAKVDPSATSTDDLKEATTEAAPTPPAEDEMQGPPELQGPNLPPDLYRSPIGPRNRLRRKAPSGPRAPAAEDEVPPMTEADIPPPGVEDMLRPGEEPGAEFAPYAADDVFERVLSEDDELGSGAGEPPLEEGAPPPGLRVPPRDERPITPLGPSASRLDARLAPDDPARLATDGSTPVTAEELAADPELAKIEEGRAAVRAKRAAAPTPTADDVAGKLPPADLSGAARLRKLADGLSQARGAVSTKLKAVGATMDMGDGHVLTRTAPDNVDVSINGETVKGYPTVNAAILSFKTPASTAASTAATPPAGGLSPAEPGVPTIDLDGPPARVNTDAVSVGGAEASVLGEDAQAGGTLAEGDATGTTPGAQGKILTQDRARRSARGKSQPAPALNPDGTAQAQAPALAPPAPPPTPDANTTQNAYRDANRVEKQGTPEQKKAVSRAKREGVLRDVLELVRPNDKASAMSAEAISRRVGSEVTPDDVRQIAQALTDLGNKWTFLAEETPEQKAALARAEAAGVTSRLQNLLEKRRFTAAEVAERLDNKLSPEEVEQAAVALPGNIVAASQPLRTPMQRATGPVERLRDDADLTETLFGRANRLRASSSQQRAMFREPTPEQIAAATEGVKAVRKKNKLKGLRYDAAGQPLVKVNDLDLPVLSQWTAPNLLDSLIKLTNGDKRLRALSGMLRKYTGDATVYMVPRDALRAATGFDGAYDEDSKSIYLPHDAAMTDDQQIHAFLHEATHAALQARLDASPAARAQIMALAGKLSQVEGVNTKAYAFTDAHEFLSEGLSNGDIQGALEELKISARDAYKMGVGDAKNGFMALVHMAAEWLGLRSQLNGLEAIMRIQQQLTDGANITPKGLMAFVNGELKAAGVSSLNKLLTSTDDREIEAGRQALANASKQLTAGAETQLRGVILDAEKLMSSVSKESIAARLQPDSSFRGWLRTKELYWSSFGHILEKFVKLFKAAGASNKNPLVAYGEHMAQRAGLTARMAQLWRNANDQWMAALARSPKIAKEMTSKLEDLMALTTEFGIDPKKSFEAQKHLMESSDVPKMRATHAKAVELLKYLEQNEKQGKDKNGDKLPGIFDVLRAVNDTLLYSYQAVQLYNMVRSDPVLRDDPAGVRAPLTLTRTDPVERFMNDASLHENPIKAAKYWREAVTGRMTETRAFLKAAQEAIKAGALSDSDASKLEGSRKPLAKMLDDIGVAMGNLERSPYFHLGRHGKFIVRFDVRRDPANDKRADPAAVARVIKALEAEFPKLGISDATDNYHMMARFESADERNKFHDLMQRLQDEGVVEKGKLTASQLDTAGANAPMQPDWLQKYITNINSSDAFTDEQKQAMVSTARITWLDMLPDTAVVRVMAKREGVPGYNKDMLRNFAFRAEVGINALANLSIAAKVREAFTEMKAQRGEAQADPARRADADMMQQVIDELATRDADRPSTTGTDWIDEVRAFNHAFFLGASPAYMIVNMTQLGVMLWPELAKRHGFVNAAKAIAKVTPMALKIIKETFNAGRKLGWSRALDSIITEDVLTQAMGDASQKELREFVQRMVNSGNIDLGSPMRELGRKATGVQETRGDRFKDNTLRFASVLGYYSETLTRLIAAMSAHDLAQRKGESDAAKLDSYASSVLNNAMFNYSNWYTARATGKAGVLGRFTPIPASFQQYTLQLLQKLYREVYDAVGMQGEGESAKDAADRRTAARKFLIGHTAALAALAGSMGMPFASVAFTVADRIRETLGDDDDEPVDTKADYRNWLATVFGKDVGQVIAHGLPRAAGFDVAGRTGEHDLLPFSRFLADRRQMQDRVKDLVMRSAGSPVSMMSGVAVGAWQMSNGEVLQGMQTLLPSALKSALKAERLATEGYVDDETKMQLPLDADALDIFWQSMGFNPAKKAEYTEANLVRATRRTLLAQKESRYRNNLIEAMQNDPDAVSEKLDAATGFGLKNPAYNPLPTLGSTMARRAKQEAVSRALEVPLGFNLRDPRERDAVAFADFGR